MVSFWVTLLNIFRTQTVKGHLFSALKDISHEVIKKETACSKTLNEVILNTRRILI